MVFGYGRDVDRFHRCLSLPRKPWGKQHLSVGKTAGGAWTPVSPITYLCIYVLRSTERQPATDISVTSSFSRFVPDPPPQNALQDRVWLEKVVSEGVRDDFKAMTEIYSRLCTYLDLAATNPPPPLHRGTGGEQASGPTSTGQSPPPAAPGGLPGTTGTVNISTGAATDFVPPAPAAAAGAAAAQGTGVPPEAAAPGTSSAASGGGALSTFIAAAPSFSSPPAGLPAAESAAAEAGAGGRAGGGGGGTTTTVEGLAALEEGLLNDLDVSAHVMFVFGTRFWGLVVAVYKARRRSLPNGLQRLLHVM